MATLKEIAAALVTLKKDPQATLRGAWETIKEAARGESVNEEDLEDHLHLLDQIMDEVIEMATPPQPRQRAPKTHSEPAGGQAT